MSKKIKLSLLFLSFFILFVGVSSVFAQDFGTNEINNTVSLAQNDPRFIIGRIIQIALSFLGVIALILVMYAGFLWATSNGEEDKVNQAKKILSNAIVGLVIILSAWGIATFVLSQLGKATGVNGGNFNGNNSNGSFSNQGIAAIGSCSVETFYPSDGQKDVPRNTSIMITFKEALKLDSVCSDGAGKTCACDKNNCNKLNPEAIRIFKNDLGDACKTGTCLNPNSNVTAVLVNLANNNKTLILSALAPLGSPTENSEYSVKFSNQLKKIDGTSVFKSCNDDFFEYSFTVNTSLDLTPPQVAIKGIFPLPDNLADTRSSEMGKPALASISFGSDCPSVYTPAKLISVTPGNPALTEIPVVTGILEKVNTKFILSVPQGATSTIEIFDANTNEALGSASFDVNGLAIFPQRFSFKVKTHDPGSSWTLIIQPEILADTLTFGQEQYTFVSETDSMAKYPSYIAIPSECSESGFKTSMQNIRNKISGNPDIAVVENGRFSPLSLSARKIGTDGNNLALSSTVESFVITPFSGGVDARQSVISQDKEDRPMNSALQINFNEPINPVNISGSADEASSSIKIVNANASSSLNGLACQEDKDCRSYKCEARTTGGANKVCVGNYLGGKYMVSNQYRTLEFITDRECGVNACGEKIYCFPANSNLSVELAAANLKRCTVDNDCMAYGEYNSCKITALGYSTCQDAGGKNYPLAEIDSLDGIVDSATNSLDGNRDLSSDGPLSFYYENNSTDDSKKDKYKWSFYIGGNINLTPPKITFISNPNGKENVDLLEPIQINFNTLMLNSSLHTGSSIVQNGTKTVSHKAINLTSSSPTPLGYWISSENQDANITGAPDLTILKIEHSAFLSSMKYKAQIGSGVRDIYQNCFKPSGDEFNENSCGASLENPSCCFGVATSELGPDGNCK